MFDRQFRSRIEAADIVVCQTRVPDLSHPRLLKLLGSMKKGAKLAAYEDVEAFDDETAFFERLEINDTNDRFFTSWAPGGGHRFHLFRRK